jgi:hypothetical protein
MKKLFTIFLVILNNIFVVSVVGQEFAQHFDAEDIFNNDSDLNYIKSNIVPRIGNVSDIRFLAVVYKSFRSQADFIAIRVVPVGDSDPFNKEDAKYRYEQVFASKNKQDLLVREITSEKADEIVKVCMPVFTKADRTSQSENLLKINGFDKGVYCYLLMRPIKNSALQGGVIISPRHDTKSHEVFEYVSRILQAGM